MALANDILESYIEAQRELIEIEPVDKNSVLVSLPLRFSAFTRIELAITQLTENQFVLTDQGQTIGELKDAGYPVGPKLIERIKQITKIWKLEMSGNTLVRTCTRTELGNTLHEFGEAAKTVGDAYLTVRTKEIEQRQENDLKEQVRQTFRDERYFFREGKTVPGEIEKGHKVDFYISPNGSNGLALEVLPNPNRLHAEAWGFKTQDMKRANSKLVVGVVFNAASDLGRTIFENVADISVPSTEMERFAHLLEEFQISKG